MKDTDWRDILVRYMNHVGACEGVYFANSFDLPCSLSRAEWEKVIEDANALDRKPLPPVKPKTKDEMELELRLSQVIVFKETK